MRSAYIDEAAEGGEEVGVGGGGGGACWVNTRHGSSARQSN